MFDKLSFGCFILLAINYTHGDNLNMTAVCSTVKDGTKVASTESCQLYYKCEQGGFQQLSCANGQTFDKNKGKCVQEDEVDCVFGSNFCKGKDKDYVGVPGDCRKWIYCEDGKEIGQGDCPNNLVFFNGKCVEKTNENCNDNAAGDDDINICDVYPNDIYFGNTENCQDWIVCKKNKPKTGKCTNQFFDVQSQSCVWDSNVCGRITGGDLFPNQPIIEKCNENEEIKPDSEICSKYYKCKNGVWKEQNCPNAEYYDINDDECKQRSKAYTVSSCDRCEYSTSTYVNAIDPQCTKFLYCKNGKKQSEDSCHPNTYFDEMLQACITVNTQTGNKEKYVATHIACKEDNNQTE